MNNDTAYRRSLATNLRRALKHRQLDQAGNLLERLQREAPLSAETRGFELELAFVAGRLAEAQTLAGELVKSHPESARIRYLAGRVAYAHKDYGTAIACFDQSNRLHPHWRSTRWLGKALTQAGDYERAEPLLLELLPAHPPVAVDLAWLHERRGDLDQAAEQLDRYLATHPDDTFAREQRLRVQSQRTSVEELAEEIEALEAVDEVPPPAMLPSYVEGLLKSARGEQARRFIQQHAPDWTSAVATAVGWACYRHHAQDLAYDLFVRALPDQLTNFKLLNTLEAAARQCRREADLVSRYRELAERDPRLYGRIKRLEPG